MKRCPQCQFIYEDEQSLCDMDGVLLVFDSRALPNVQALQTVSPKTEAKRYRAVPAFATLILAVVLGGVYFVSTQRAQIAEAPPAATSVVDPAPVVVPTPEPSPVEVAQPTPEVEEPKEATTKPAAVTTAKKPITKTTAKEPAKPATEKKNDSKVGSILKKTGRILKKPFKF